MRSVKNYATASVSADRSITHGWKRMFNTLSVILHGSEKKLKLPGYMILFSLAAFIASPPATAQVNVNWSALGYGTDGEVFCSAIDPANGNLYIGGTFSKAISD